MVKHASVAVVAGLACALALGGCSSASSLTSTSGSSSSSSAATSAAASSSAPASSSTTSGQAQTSTSSVASLEEKAEAMVEKVEETSEGIVDAATDAAAPYVETLKESISGDTLAVGGTATYPSYTVQVDGVSKWSGGTRVHVVIEATASRKVQVSWFEGVSSLGSIAEQDTTGKQELQLTGTLQTTKGSTIEGYIYYKADSLQSLRFSGGVLQPDRVWSLS